MIIVYKCGFGPFTEKIELLRRPTEESHFRCGSSNVLDCWECDLQSIGIARLSLLTALSAATGYT